MSHSQFFTREEKTYTQQQDDAGLHEYLSSYRNLIKTEYIKITIKIQEAEDAIKRLEDKNISPSELEENASTLYDLHTYLKTYCNTVVGSNEELSKFINTFYNSCIMCHAQLNQKKYEKLKEMKQLLFTLDTLLNTANAERQANLVLEFYQKKSLVTATAEIENLKPRKTCAIL